MKRSDARVLAAVALTLALGGQVRAADPTVFDKVGPDQLGFSVENMDRRVSPRDDFAHYAAGGWAARVERPARLAELGMSAFLSEHLKAQMAEVVARAAAGAATAPKGSPSQQIGDLYAAYMDSAALDALGVAPLKPEFNRIDAIGSFKDLSEYLGHCAAIAAEVCIMAIVPSADQADNSRMILYFAPATTLMPREDIYRDPEGSPRHEAYLAYVRDMLVASGFAQERAERMARTALAMERAFVAAKLTPVEAVDPRATYNPMRLDELQAKMPEFDLAALARGMGAEPPETLVVAEPRYPAGLSALARARPLDDFKDYLRVKLIARFSPYLGRRYDAVTLAVNKALTGATELPSPDARAQAMLREHIGHPLSKLYVENFFSEATRAKAKEMIERIKAKFAERLQSNDWLSEPTRKAALEKLAALSYRVGYPDAWVDYSSVEIRPGRLVENLSALIRFEMKRDLDKLGKPVVPDQFNNSRYTLPVIINAAYDRGKNGFEVPAAILQPPAFEPQMDAPVYFCRMGAILGHEMTHGFDSSGRQFDAKGNLRDWWTPADDKAFAREALKLVAQAEAFEILPGLRLNGALTVTENMADLGGMTLAYEALKTYLAEHPNENVAIDGLSPAQRCFIAWAQLWADKQTEPAMRSLAATDNHAPGWYRAYAPLQHLDAFYEAFGVKPGDPMWLAPEKRVRAW